MDYEKKYNEALSQARFYHGNCPTEPEKKKLEKLFPELRESEDERIIRAIIDALYSHTNSINLLSSRGYQMGNIEAWLEKQKYDRMKPVYDNQDSFESALEKAWKDYNDSGARTVDGCEDNYVECAHAKGFREGYLFGLEKQKEQDDKGLSEKIAAAYQLGRSDERNQKEQKSAEWSKEDEMYLSQAIETLEHENYLILADKLKSIRPVKSAWSEEDEETRKDILAILEQFGRGLAMTTRERRDKMVSWMRNLRPSWKPSEEQIYSLGTVVNGVGEASVGSIAYNLKDLYEQLKKL